MLLRETFTAYCTALPSPSHSSKSFSLQWAILHYNTTLTAGDSWVVLLINTDYGSRGNAAARGALCVEQHRFHVPKIKYLNRNQQKCVTMYATYTKRVSLPSQWRRPPDIRRAPLACSEAGTVASKPIVGMDVGLPFFCVCVALCRSTPYDGPIPHPESLILSKATHIN